jgi:hypothetical protein
MTVQDIIDTIEGRLRVLERLKQRTTENETVNAAIHELENILHWIKRKNRS